MNRLNGRFRIAAILLPAVLLSACGSQQHKPDTDSLLRSDDCSLVNGRYVIDSAADGGVLADAIFESTASLDSLEIVKSASQVAMRGNAGNEALTRDFQQRYSCANSVLTLVLRDEGGGGGAAMAASDTKLQLFAKDAGTLNFRIIDSTLAFLFIVPYYKSADKEIVLRRQRSKP